MGEKNVSKSTAFLVELLILIVFFAYSGAVCAKAFVLAGNRSKAVEERQNAYVAAQTAGELAKALAHDAQALAKALGAKSDGGRLTVGYDGDWNEAENSPEYVLTVDIRREDGGAGRIFVAEIAVAGAGGEELISLEALRYVPGAGE